MFVIDNTSGLLVLYSLILVTSSHLKVSIIHINDFHARFEETTPSSGICKNNSGQCIGGFSRMYTVVNDLYRTRQNPISLNAGDNFQGTPWYSVFKWNVTQFFFNLLPTDAMTLGNHEFDDGLDGLIPFLKAIKAPIVVCNINDTLEPNIQGLYRKSIVKVVDGKKIGIVGVISTATTDVSDVGKLSFLDESQSLNSEARRLLKEEGVFTVIILAHCAYEFEKELARLSVPGVSLIVGGHSHTLLYNGIPPVGAAVDTYPTVITSIYNETVLVVQADGFSRYVGNLSLEYDADGKLNNWEGNPIYLDEKIPQDEYINELLASYKLEIDQIGHVVFGKTNVHLDQSSCSYSECNLGNLITDSLVDYYTSRISDRSGANLAIGIINSGGIRSSIEKGDITLNNLRTVLPFQDKVVWGELRGEDIKYVMEAVSAPFFYRKMGLDINLVQVSGLKIIVDLTEPIGSRVVSLKVLSRNFTFEAVDFKKFYPIITTSYLAGGGDNHRIIKDNLRNRTEGPSLIEVISDYIKRNSPLTIGLDGRIVVNGRNESVINT